MGSVKAVTTSNVKIRRNADPNAKEITFNQYIPQ